MHVRYNDGYDSPYAHHGAKHSGIGKFLLIVLAIVFPPLAVFLMYGFRGEFWLNLLLVILFYVPALVHAVWLVARR